MFKAIDIDTGVEYSFNNVEDLRLSLRTDRDRPIDEVDSSIYNYFPAYVYIDPYVDCVHGRTIVRGSPSYEGAREERYQKARDI